MTGNTFQVAAVWRFRNESVEDLADGALKTMDALTEICPFCEEWNVPNYSQPGYGPDEMMIPTIPLPQVRHRLADFVGYGVSRDDDGTPNPRGGFSLRTGTEQELVSRHIQMGCHGARLNAGSRASGASFRTAHNTYPDPAITAYPVIRKILTAYIRIWKPDYAVATTSDLIEHERYLGRIFAGKWMIYLSSALAKRIANTDDVPIVQVADGGLILIAADETFDVANPAHLAGARAIRDAIAPLNR